jgi:acyl-CoA hydrolase
MLADHVEKNKLQGKLKYNLFVGASTGAETEDRWAKNDMIDRRYPHQVGRNIQAGINSGRIRFADKHLSEFGADLVDGFCKQILYFKFTNYKIPRTSTMDLNLTSLSSKQQQSQRKEISFLVLQ